MVTESRVSTDLGLPSPDCQVQLQIAHDYLDTDGTWLLLSALPRHMLIGVFAAGESTEWFALATTEFTTEFSLLRPIRCLAYQSSCKVKQIIQLCSEGFVLNVARGTCSMCVALFRALAAFQLCFWATLSVTAS
jgi:hypothetical protein